MFKEKSEYQGDFQLFYEPRGPEEGWIAATMLLSVLHSSTCLEVSEKKISRCAWDMMPSFQNINLSELRSSET